METNEQRWEWYSKNVHGRRKKTNKRGLDEDCESELFIEKCVGLSGQRWLLTSHARFNQPPLKSGESRPQDTKVTVSCVLVKDSAIEVRGTPDRLWRALALEKTFLFLSSSAGTLAERFVTKHGAILLAPDFAGLLYVKGVFVCKLGHRWQLKLVRGYDLPDAKLSATRRDVSQTYDLPAGIVRIWGAAIEADPKRFAPLFLDLMTSMAATTGGDSAAAADPATGAVQAADDEDEKTSKDVRAEDAAAALALSGSQSSSRLADCCACEDVDTSCYQPLRWRTLPMLSAHDLAQTRWRSARASTRRSGHGRAS